MKEINMNLNVQEAHKNKEAPIDTDNMTELEKKKQQIKLNYPSPGKF